MPRRIYTEEQKGVALAYLEACGGNLDRAAKACDVPRNTLRRWRDGEAGQNVAVSQVRQSATVALDVRLDALVDTLIGGVPLALTDATLPEITTSLSVTIDKIIALRSLPTPDELCDDEGEDDGSDDDALDDAERTRLLAGILDAARSRAAGHTLEAAPPQEIEWESAAETASG